MVDVDDNEKESTDDGAKSPQEIGIGHEKETFEFIMLVGTNSHSLGFLDEIKSRLLVDDFELVDSFF